MIRSKSTIAVGMAVAAGASLLGASYLIATKRPPDCKEVLQEVRYLLKRATQQRFEIGVAILDETPTEMTVAYDMDLSQVIPDSKVSFFNYRTMTMRLITEPIGCNALGTTGSSDLLFKNPGIEEEQDLSSDGDVFTFKELKRYADAKFLNDPYRPFVGEGSEARKRRLEKIEFAKVRAREAELAQPIDYSKLRRVAPPPDSVQINTEVEQIKDEPVIVKTYEVTGRVTISTSIVGRETNAKNPTEFIMMNKKYLITS